MLTDEIQQAKGEEGSNQLYQLAMAAFSLSNGRSYNTQPDNKRAEELTSQLNAVKHEAIRKQCNWENQPPRSYGVKN